ncbi:hypothetical protein OsJ_24644 [Oryza sativa Japonica Group]|uniref:Uncharacterized protein n=1 Tax=Oryza sativa subsp. japonica TaxID=39947 RepID=A3BKW2_ORYSJ|nr:hypothetical protein OsJ_24644 [Oryza sativa Japonica Group]
MSVAEEQEKGPLMNMKKPLAVDHTELAMDPWWDGVCCKDHPAFFDHLSMVMTCVRFVWEKHQEMFLLR